MRQILLGVITASILISCSEKESLTFDKELQQLSDKPQIFTVTNHIGDTLETKNGTRIIIKPNTFVFNDGQDTKEPIQIEVKDVFDKSEMILNGVGTVSNGRLLESYGMVNLAATVEGKELKIKDNNSITVIIPNKKQGLGGELFYGVQTDSLLNWDQEGPKADSITVIETIVPLIDGQFVVRRTTSNSIMGYDSTSTEQANYVPKSYEFEVSNLGWINCDRFIDFSNKTSIAIYLKKHSQPIAYMVFVDINSIMDFYFNNKGVATIDNLPSGYPVKLIVIDKIENDYMWADQNLILGSQTKINIETRKIKIEDLKNNLKKLDK